MDAELDFRHYKCELDKEDIKPLVSKTSNESKRWTALKELPSVKKPTYISRLRTTYPEELLLSANIAYVESVFSNPLADLLETDKWKTGKRTFPYIGLYLTKALVINIIVIPTSKIAKGWTAGNEWPTTLFFQYKLRITK